MESFLQSKRKFINSNNKEIGRERGQPCLNPFWGCVGVLTGNLPRGVPEVDECGLANIGNSKEEIRGTQFRHVRAARCVIPYVLYVL
jgi:hypothetical protein